MTSTPRFSLRVYCPMITASSSSGSTMNGIVNWTGRHGVSIVGWSGHDCVTISHSWPKNVTIRACPTNAYANAVCVIPGCCRRASTSASDTAVIPEQESMRTFTSATAHAPVTTRRPATCCVSTSMSCSVSTLSTLVSPDPRCCKTETRAHKVLLESPRHCCDAGAGSGTVTE